MRNSQLIKIFVLNFQAFKMYKTLNQQAIYLICNWKKTVNYLYRVIATIVNYDADIFIVENGVSYYVDIKRRA